MYLAILSFVEANTTKLFVHYKRSIFDIFSKFQLAGILKICRSFVAEKTIKAGKIKIEQ